MPLSRALSGLDVLDVSGNALGASGAAVLLLAQQELQVAADEKENADGAGVRRCQLKMEDVCVRPDTSLAGLVMRAAAGDAIPIGEMEASGVQAAAAIALRSAKPPPKPPGQKKGGKQPAPGEEPGARPDAAAPQLRSPPEGEGPAAVGQGQKEHDGARVAASAGHSAIGTCHET